MSDDNLTRFIDKYAAMAKTICDEVHEKVTPHMWRHSRALHLYRKGVPLPLISEWLGHSSMETTLIYAYADTEMKRKAIEKATNANHPLCSRSPTPYGDADNVAREARQEGHRGVGRRESRKSGKIPCAGWSICAGGWPSTRRQRRRKSQSSLTYRSIWRLKKSGSIGSSDCLSIQTKKGRRPPRGLPPALCFTSALWCTAPAPQRAGCPAPT